MTFRIAKRQVGLNLYSRTLLISITGKACFVCKHDGKETDLIHHRKCSRCTPTVDLPKSPQRVLEHGAGHSLFDINMNISSEPCGFCSRPSGVCIFYLKKGKGADTSIQIDYKRSTCPYLAKFSYSVAAVSSPSSPCSNVPVRCQWCPDSAPAVWKYNMPSHVKTKHSYVPLADNEHEWKIGNSERHELKKLWDARYNVKASRKGSKKGKKPLVISDAHNSRLTLA